MEAGKGRMGRGAVKGWKWQPTLPTGTSLMLRLRGGTRCLAPWMRLTVRVGFGASGSPAHPLGAEIRLCTRAPNPPAQPPRTQDLLV
jgi:hypothetical protein